MKLELELGDAAVEKIVRDEMESIICDDEPHSNIDDENYYRTLRFAAEVILRHYSVQR